MLGTDQGIWGIGAGSPSKLYKWNSNSFVEFQTFPGAFVWKHFVINNEHYLVGGGYDALKTYKWNGSAFAEIQSILISGWANDCKFFTIGTNYYLAVAIGQHYVYVYKWNSSGFMPFQTLSTNWIDDLEF
ncbi:MAG: hypothetical protein BWK80_38680, partial [Desulfobacteraceae bacterium IS3]